MTRVFSTQIPVESEASLSNLLRIGKEWISGSPNSPLKEKDLRDINKHGDFIESGQYRFELGKTELDEYNAVGIRYQNPEKGSMWSTDIVGLKYPGNFLVSITADYEASGAGLRIPVAKKPYILRQVLERIGGGLDGNIVVGDNPIYIKEGDEDFVSDMLRGRTRSVMPLVYMSRDRNNLLTINPHTLSKVLSGIANVLIEPSWQFSFALREQMNGQNVFGGAVGIYWPEGYGRFFWLPEHIENERNPINQIYKKLIDGLNSRRVRRELTFDNIKIVQNQRTLKEILESYKTDSNELDKVYTSILDDKDREIAKAEDRITTLEAELRKISLNTGHGEGIIKSPQVNQIYHNEVRRILIDALKYSLNQIPEDTRRHIILRDIIDSNSDFEDSRDEIVGKIKRIFRDYNGLTGQIRRELQKAGFSIEGDGKHYKITVQGLSMPLPKTPSDWRSGKNSSSHITRKFF